MDEYDWKERERQQAVAELQRQEAQTHKKRVEWCVWNWRNTMPAVQASVSEVTA